MLKNKLETFDRLWLLFDLFIYLFQLDMLALDVTERQSPAPPVQLNLCFELIKC